jgi:hypothetical protein
LRRWIGQRLKPLQLLPAFSARLKARPDTNLNHLSGHGELR